jgi:hypothetical protein
MTQDIHYLAIFDPTEDPTRNLHLYPQHFIGTVRRTHEPRRIDVGGEI